MRYIVTILLFLSIYGCNELGSFDYIPTKDVEFHFNFVKAEHSKEHNATFVYFELQITNNASEAFYFNPGMLQAKINDSKSQETYYDSLASVMPERKIVKKGKESYNLYFVLPVETSLDTIEKFEVLKSGLDQG